MSDDGDVIEGVVSGIGPFGLLPRWLTSRTDVSPGAKLLWGVIASYADRGTGSCYPERETLAEDMACSVSSIDRYKTELTKAGLLSVRRRATAHGRTSNLYRIDFNAPPDTRLQRRSAANQQRRSAAGTDQSEQTRKVKDTAHAAPLSRLAVARENPLDQDLHQAIKTFVAEYREWADDKTETTLCRLVLDADITAAEFAWARAELERVIDKLEAQGEPVNSPFGLMTRSILERLADGYCGPNDTARYWQARQAAEPLYVEVDPPLWEVVDA